MRVTINTVRKYNIEMTESEAHWLREVMQNPLFGESPDEEDLNNKENRKCIFEGLSHGR